MTTPFNNSIVGEQGTLVRSQIKSPNFSLAGQTGWAILKNGNAYFFNITATGTITATTFAGTDFVINSAGEFYYSGAPAAGNLVYSNVPGGSGTDTFGNHYLGNGATWYNSVSGTAMGAQAGELVFYTGSLSTGWTTLVAQLFWDSTHNQLTTEGPVAMGGVSGTVLRVTNNLAGSPLNGSVLLQVDGEAAVGSIVAIVAGAAETWHQITTGFPAGFSGRINYRQLAETTLVMIDWAITIAATTVVNSGATMATLPSGYFYATDNKVSPATITGGGLAAAQFSPMTLSSAGAFKYAGPTFTPSATAFWYGQTVIETAV